MCIEFFHTCDDEIVQELFTQLGPEEFFLVCLGRLNYLYAKTTEHQAKLEKIFNYNQILFFIVSRQDFLAILNRKVTTQFQSFQGNKELYANFLKET